jgi:hypothetical protein
MSNTRRTRKVKRQTFYILRFWDGLPAWAIERYRGCECGEPHEADADAREIGAAIVPGKNLDQAIRTAWSLGCNPGSEVMGGELELGAAELESVSVPVGVLIEDTHQLDVRLNHARMHLS